MFTEHFTQIQINIHLSQYLKEHSPKVTIYWATKQASEKLKYPPAHISLDNGLKLDFNHKNRNYRKHTNSWKLKSFLLNVRSSFFIFHSISTQKLGHKPLVK